MQCLILAGGLGTRMLPMTEQMPKVLLPVNGCPFADYQLQWLAGQGVTRVVFSIGHLGEMVREFAGDGGKWNLDITYTDEGSAPRGTAGAIRLAVERGQMDEGFFVLYGDSYLDIDMPAVWAASDNGEHPFITVYRNQGRWDASNAKVQDGKVIHFEKGRTDAAEFGMEHIDYGLSVLTRQVILDEVATEGASDLAEVYHNLSIRGDLCAFEATERFYEIGSPQGLADLEAYLLKIEDRAANHE